MESRGAEGVGGQGNGWGRAYGEGGGGTWSSPPMSCLTSSLNSGVDGNANSPRVMLAYVIVSKPWRSGQGRAFTGGGGGWGREGAVRQG